MNDEIPDDMSELFDAQVPRVDLVDKAANGLPFLIAKADGPSGLMPPDFVRELIAKADPESPGADPRETVTMSGSPAAIAALIHGAPVRKAAPAVADPDDVAKAEESAKAQNDLPDSAFAFIEPGGKKDESGKTVPRSLRHFNIHDKAHADNAAARIAQGAKFGDKAKGKVEAAQRKFGEDVSKADAAPEQTEVTKDMDMPMDDEGGMDPSIVLAEPENDTDGDPGDPGSPAWEAIDAATARKWTAIAARLRSALGVMSDREALEAVTADPDDAENAMDLGDAACAVDYVIDTLAGFAVDEQAEADDAVMAAVGKSIGALDIAHLDTVESLGSIRKAGRTLSAANETALRQAIQALQQILASLPAAPVTKEAGEPVAKTANEESDMPTPTPSEDVTAASGQEPAMGSAEAPPKPVAGVPVTDVTKQATPPTPAEPETPAPVAKAEKTPQVAIYDANGNLVGTVDPTEITMLAPAKAPEAAAKAEPAEAPEEPAAPAAEAPAAPPADLTPAPAASVGTPADATPADDDTVTKAADTTTSNEAQEVLKGSIQELVKAALAEQSTQQGELVKALEDRNLKLEERNEALAKQATSLEERLTKVENQPAVMAIASNGAIPPAHQMRGQNRGAQVDMTQGQILKARLTASDDAIEKKQIADEMEGLALAKFQEMRRR